MNDLCAVAAAYLRNNQVAVKDIPAVIKTIYDGFSALDKPAVAELIPAVPVKKSIFPDYIICLEDGKKLKMLKRHLQSSYGLTPDEYRAKWGLPADYPMVAPNYAKSRSELAMKIGLGRRLA